MSEDNVKSDDERRIREILEQWARATRRGHKDEVLANHAPDVLLFDVLPPLKYTSASAYRESLDEWWPESQGEGLFDLHELKIVAGADVSYAHALIHCGGTSTDGEAFEDWVRATFCLRKVDGRWLITHQHVSMPAGGGN